MIPRWAWILLLRAGAITAAAWLLLALPSPPAVTGPASLPLKNGIVTVGAIFALGKLLYDTLFFDRYRR